MGARWAQRDDNVERGENIEGRSQVQAERVTVNNSFRGSRGKRNRQNDDSKRHDNAPVEDYSVVKAYRFGRMPACFFSAALTRPVNAWPIVKRSGMKAGITPSFLR